MLQDFRLETLADNYQLVLVVIGLLWVDDKLGHRFQVVVGLGVHEYDVLFELVLLIGNESKIVVLHELDESSFVEELRAQLGDVVMLLGVLLQLEPELFIVLFGLFGLVKQLVNLAGNIQIVQIQVCLEAENQLQRDGQRLAIGGRIIGQRDVDVLLLALVDQYGKGLRLHLHLEQVGFELDLELIHHDIAFVGDSELQI